MSKELICPHCGAIQETHEPDQISADMCWTQCEECGKDFWYSVSATRDYDSWDETEVLNFLKSKPKSLRLRWKNTSGCG